MARPAQISRRARKVPALLWPSWAVRLEPRDGAYHRTLAPVLASAVLLVGSQMDLDGAAIRLGSVTDGLTISRILQLLADDPHWEAIAAAIAHLAAYLDNHDVPVDYDRRRRLDYSGLLSPRQWLDLCRRTGISPGRGRRDKNVGCLLFACLSGLPVESAPHFGTLGEAYLRAETARFAAVARPSSPQHWTRPRATSSSGTRHEMNRSSGTHRSASSAISTCRDPTRPSSTSPACMNSCGAPARGRARRQRSGHHRRRGPSRPGRAPAA